jgi:hypothetical protein
MGKLSLLIKITFTGPLCTAHIVLATRKQKKGSKAGKTKNWL